MHCKRNEKDVWVCVGEGPRHPVTGRRKQITRSAKTKKAAEQRVQEAVKNFERNFLLEESISFHNLAQIWLENYQHRGIKDSTLTQRKYCISVLNKHIAQIEVKKITSITLQNMLNALSERNVAQSSIKGIHSVAKMIFTYAKKVGLITEVPTDSTFIPRKRLKIVDVERSTIEKKYLNVNELKCFLEALNSYNSPVIKTILYLITFTGMRPGEAIALSPKDMDFELDTININKTVWRKNGVKNNFELTPPKTLSSIRQIDVDHFVMEMIKDMQDYQLMRNYKESEYLFRMSDGYPPAVDYLRTVTRRIGEKTSLTKRLHTYMLRHTHISLLAEAGVDLPYIMNRVGHKNSKTTTDIYLHVTEGMRENAKEKMHQRFNNLLV